MATPSRTEATSPRPTFTVHSSQTAPRRRGRKFVYFLLGALVLIVGLVVLYTKIWPFSRDAILQDLAEASASTVTAQAYHPTYFPPGCVLEGVEFRHGDDQFKLITIEKLVIEGSYNGILRSHVPRITAVGAHIHIPRFGTNPTFDTQHSKTVVDEIIANGSYVEFEPKDGGEPLRFDVYDASFKNVRWGSPIDYRLRFHNPNPPGEIAVSGKFGAWTTGRPEQTPFSGQYKFDYADLGVYGGIAGTLASEGKFEGKLGQVNVSGTTDTPDFVVQSGGRKVRLQTKFDAYVDAIHGDTYLRRVDAHWGHTHVIAEGSIAGAESGQPDRRAQARTENSSKGKIAKLHLNSSNARIEDVLGLFTSDRSPMSGPMILQTKVEIPPGNASFLNRVQLTGGFGINAGSFQSGETQKDVNELSAGARGQKMEDPETVLTDLSGIVTLHHGVANFAELRFGVPGAKARLQGTYNIVSYKIGMHGMMKVDTKISKTTTGVKSLFLKMLDPIFKKKKHGEVVAIHILGTYEKPEFGLDLGGNQVSQQSSR